MNKQEIFNIVSKHLLSQRRKACGAGGFKYRTKDGLKCAIGVLIPDESYDESMEYKSLPALSSSGLFAKLPDYFVTEFEFLCCLQSIHDNHDPETWEKELRYIAKMYNLKCAF